MRKLIKKYLYGSEFAMDKSTGYPNTTNIGAQTLNLGGKNNPNGYIVSTPYIDPSLAKIEGLPVNTAQTNTNFFNKMGGWNAVGNVSSALSSLIPTHKSAEVLAADLAFDAASDAMMMINPMVGGIMKAGGFLSDGLNALGVRTDLITGTDKFLGSKFMTLTPTGLINNTFTTKLDSLANNQDVQEALAMSDGGYGGFRMGWDDASKYSGKTIGFFNSADEYNRKIHEANRLMSVLQRITGRKKRDDLLTALMEDRWNLHTMNLLNGGFGNISFGRLGLKIEILPKIHEILNKPKVIDTLREFEEEIPEFKEGGKMNVIPEGALHARLHHMENAEGLTKKGIPVVSIAEGGEIELQAEIELNEIIFNLETTTELEKLMQDGSDNAAIEAGKLLVKEIFENTDDRTGLIDKLTGGELTPEEAVRNHLVFQDGGTVKPKFEDWLLTVPEDRRNMENYNLKRAFELAPWEQLEKWRKATPEQLRDDSYHLNTFYWNKEGVGEFVKKNGHPTLIKELEFYFGENPKSKEFREKYDLDMSGEYFKYMKK